MTANCLRFWTEMGCSGVSWDLKAHHLFVGTPYRFAVVRTSSGTKASAEDAVASKIVANEQIRMVRGLRAVAKLLSHKRQRVSVLSSKILVGIAGSRVFGQLYSFDIEIGRALQTVRFLKCPG
jgi:hypothetical protein